MTRIAVSDNSLVDFSHEQWRLIHIDQEANPTLLAEINADENFRYSGDFGKTRELPPSGEIAPRDIGAIDLRWSADEGAWQLGMTLSPELSASQAGRWFEVLRIDDPDQSRSQATIELIGQSLAQLLDKALAMPSPAALPEEPPPPLIDLPLELGVWSLNESNDPEAENSALRFTRGQSWLQAKYRQMLWHAILAAIYAAVSLASLTQPLGLPNDGTLIPSLINSLITTLANALGLPNDAPIPDPNLLLPYLGLGVALLLLLMIAAQFRRIRREPDAILISDDSHNIAAKRGKDLRWTLDVSQVQSIYASEVIKKRGRKLVIQHAEINLRLINGQFHNLLVEDDKRVDELLPGFDPEHERTRPPGVAPLEPRAASTALQAAALRLGASLGQLPVWYDRRAK